MKNYIIVAVIIILIIVGVVWYKAKTPAPIGDETVVTTEATTTDMAPAVDTSDVPAVDTSDASGTPVAE